jgi:hypothetical protein
MRDFFSVQNFRRGRPPGAFFVAWPRRVAPSLRITLLLLFLIVAGTTFTVSAQTALKSVEVVQPFDGSSLKIDFSLPAADRVFSIDVTANGAAVGKDKVKFTPADKLPNYHCAVLLLVDKTLGNSRDTADKSREKLWKAVRETLGRFSAVADQAPYQMGVATMAAGNMEVLAAMGSKKNILDSAIEKLPFNGVSPELYLGTRRAIEWFSGTPAERKYIILLSDGISNDKVASQQDVVQAALKARIHICTIGFPKSTEARDGVQRLGPLADETGGVALRPDGSEPRLPADAESHLLKFMVSGGRAEIHLDGSKGPAPVDLEGKIQTEFGKVYTFAQQVPVSPVRATSAGDLPVSTPASTPQPETWGARLRDHLVLAIVGGTALFVALFLAVILIVRSQNNAAPAAPAPEPFPEPDQTYVPAPLDTEPTQTPEPSVHVYAWLVTLDADQTRFPITKSAVRIGRKPDNDIVMKNDSVSSHHAEIIRRGDKFIIADLEASNGVFIGGKKVDKMPLAEGDVIELGEVRLRFTLESQRIEP